MKMCVPHLTDTLLGSYLVQQTCLFVETLPGILILPFFPFFIITKIFYLVHSSQINFCAIVSGSRVRQGSPTTYHFGGTRSILS